jgi:hypothetical protein
VLIMPKGSSSNKATIFGVRESNLYRLKGRSMRAIANNTMTKSMEQVAPKVEQLRGSQPLGSSGKEQPSKTIKKESWYEMVMQDAKE